MSSVAPPPHDLADRLRDVQVGTRAELEATRQIFRDESAYVILDPVTFQAHRLSVQNYQIFVRLDGQRPLGEVFNRLVDEKVLTRDRECDFYQFIVQLNQLGLLSLPISNAKTLYARFERRRAARRRGRIMGALFLRVPLLQPDAFLTRTVRFVAPLFTRAALLLWLIAMAAGVLVVTLRWNEFRDPLGTMLAVRNLPLLWTLLVALKLAHEFGHAYACKHFGGRVPEMGAYFILFTPCAYVDASATWGFPNRAHRIIVSLAGMYVESIIALGALLVWCLTGPTAIHATAQYVVILSTVVTVGFNINPLMRYDGYYIFSDLVNVPNLRQLATRQTLVTLKRFVLGVRTEPVVASRRGQWSLCAFGVASVLYKTTVLVGICMLVAFKVPVIGIGLGIAYVATAMWGIAGRLVRYVAWSDEVAPVRRRAIVVTVLLLAVGPLGLLLLPTPGSVQLAGVVGRRDDQVIRAEGTGFLQSSSVEVGSHVGPGTAVCRLENIDITAALRAKEAEVTQLCVQLLDEAHADPLAAAATWHRLERVRLERGRLAAMQSALTVVAPANGQIAETTGLEDVGRFVHQGEPLARLSAGPWVLHCVATENALSTSVPAPGDHVEIRLLGHAGPVYHGTVTRVARAGSRHIDHASLTHLGGGSIPVAQGTHDARQPYFHITIAFDRPDSSILRDGMTALAAVPGRRTRLATHLHRRALQLLDRLRVAG
jgi:putative peptide zinc metalloprotease protein